MNVAPWNPAQKVCCVGTQQHGGKSSAVAQGGVESAPTAGIRYVWVLVRTGEKSNSLMSAPSPDPMSHSSQALIKVHSVSAIWRFGDRVLDRGAGEDPAPH